MRTIYYQLKDEHGNLLLDTEDYLEKEKMLKKYESEGKKVKEDERKLFLE
jgi:hypothetical protein